LASCWTCWRVSSCSALCRVYKPEHKPSGKELPSRNVAATN
jgi:hypothetical protein